MWTSPAFYVAVVSLMANVGNYLHTLSVKSTAKKVQAALDGATSIRKSPTP